MIATNSYRFNYTMELWELRNYTAKELLDVLNEKVLQLSEGDRIRVMDKAKKDVAGMSIGENVLRMAG